MGNAFVPLLPKHSREQGYVIIFGVGIRVCSSISYVGLTGIVLILIQNSMVIVLPFLKFKVEAG